MYYWWTYYIECLCLSEEYHFRDLLTLSHCFFFLFFLFSRFFFFSFSFLQFKNMKICSWKGKLNLLAQTLNRMLLRYWWDSSHLWTLQSLKSLVKKFRIDFSIVIEHSSSFSFLLCSSCHSCNVKYLTWPKGGKKREEKNP